MSDTTEKARVKKLVEKWAELHQQQGLILADLQAILHGEAGTGDKLRELFTVYGNLWKLEYGSTYVFTRTDGASLKKLLQVFTVEDICARIASYLENKEPFYAKDRHTVTKFCFSINSHAGQPKANGPTEAQATAEYLERMRQ